MRRILIIIIISATLVSGCGSGETDGHLIIMSWNVQNLFDDVDNGTEYREFDPGQGVWNYDRFHRKALALADVITAAVPGGPDIVILQEVENENALTHLNEYCLKSSGYQHSIFFPTENSAVGTAVLSRCVINSANSHAVNASGIVKGRNISVVQLSLPESGEELSIFINHWKSKLGGAEETEPYRIAAAELLAGLMAEESGDSGFVLAAGDFNESHNESLRVDGAYPTALADGFLCAEGAPELYNPWTDAGVPGSYYYDGTWQTIDQFFLSFDFFEGGGWEYDGFETAVLGFNSTDGGFPLGWQSSSGTGCSDHFPILLKLKLSEQL
ncbi:MAG: endonuclease/exonuclease/phosphatase family protein [Spirochaetales bacterium]|uniref:Endonuclease/exonuclease/phosphatase family protein n=1 Tax=Candidatus Thalassospirochaeta sargassi TaxID=3119039 RepID=A0AAJ1IHY6_9SPIO|nr:endonuclease/exonuclease/phosphatase family protein [Spirochaetales bacterium]